MAVGCAQTTVEKQTATTTGGTRSTGIANPASVNCGDKGGWLEIRNDTSTPEGGQVGYCIFFGGHECEEWALFRGECTSTGTAAENSEMRGQKLARMDGFKVEKILKQVCTTDADCTTPDEYKNRDNCAHVALCFEQKCTVVEMKGECGL